jgi:tetratricopeptide (TPR) repeat protein
LPKTFDAVTDNKGRFSMIGLQKGLWTFSAIAPGYAPASGRADIATLKPNPPIEFKLEKAAGATGALAGVNTKELQSELAAADAMVQAKQYDEAAAAYKAILAKVPALTALNVQIGNAYRLKKDYDSALAAYQEALKGDPASEQAKIAIGVTNLEKGDLKAAEDILTPLASVSNSRDVLYSLGEVKFAQGQPDEAAKWYQKAADADAAWVKPVFKLGLVAAAKNDKANAITLMEKAIALDPNSSEAAQAKVFIEQLKKT